jgi:NADH-quinone oxidoreductase subunit H
VPVLVFAGAGAGCLFLSKRQPIKGYALGVSGLGLVFLLVGALFAIPMVNVAAAPVFWFFFKLFLVMYLFIWLRGTFPRYRYDQLMNIGWKIMIPTALGSIFVNAVVGMLKG